MRCPLCKNLVYQEFSLAKSKDESVSFGYCRCGCIFNSQDTDKSVYTSEYLKKLADIKYADERYEYICRIYMPLIEEQTYGRDVLDVGCGSGAILKLLEKRGWNTDGIDLCPGNGYIEGDFEQYDFFANGKDYRYDLVIMNDSLQCMKDPVKAIYKAYALLKPNGILFINCPNTDLIRNGAVREFGHFNIKEVSTLINYSILDRILAKCDEAMDGNMRVIFADKEVISKRFTTWNTMHVIAQKKKIEDILTIEDMKELANAELVPGK